MEKATIFKITKASEEEYLKGWTKLFLKGCPLRCKWCDTPESFRRTPDFYIDDSTCTECGLCVDSCTSAALYIEGMRIIHNVSNCQMCDKCLSVCPTHSIRIIGEAVRSDELLNHLLLDMEGKGVVLTGGEPYMQPNFVMEMLQGLKENGISTAVDTSGYTSFEHLKRTAPYVDCFLYDMKHIDAKKHAKYTGVSNQLILENLRNLCNIHDHVIARIPLVEGFNTDDEALESMFSFADECGVEQVQLIPFYQTDRERFYHIAAFEVSDAQFEPLKAESLSRALELGGRYAVEVVQSGHSAIDF
ncbi:MAG TPA: glycyl-radical enzyme activating protein [Firmicutes bacterium]|nr:glycyl-radical enzyme activating protein [Bacillota bacterium]